MAPKPDSSSARILSRLWRRHHAHAHQHGHPLRRRYLSLRASSPYALRRQQHFLRSVAFVAAVGSAASVYQWLTGQSPLLRNISAEGPASDDEIDRSSRAPAPPTKLSPDEYVFEEPKTPQDASKDETRDRISSQHLQVRKSWENPGVWCWGSNEGKVASPDGKENIVRQPKWMKTFDGKLLRDLKLTKTFGAAISDDGDLLQWGSAYSADQRDPVRTLAGKNLVKLALSKDRVLALSAHGDVYSLSVSLDEQTLGPKPAEASWIPFWPRRSPVSYRTLRPAQLHWGERVSGLVSGQDHAVLLTTAGRVFTLASGSDSFPDRGQLGVPGLTWFTRPAGRYDQPHEVTALHGFRITQVAAGDHHTLALDAKGRVFAWGDNQRGQLGLGETLKETPYYDAPALLPMAKLYAGTPHRPTPVRVFAGGNTSFIAVDAERVALPTDDPDTPAMLRGLGRVTADTWACGHGIWGQLGTGRWTHVQALPTKVAPLSGLFEWDEGARRAVPIRVRDVAVGASHVAAVLDNVTYVDAGARTGGNDTNWGADVLFFGNNEFYQLGTGKRNNVVAPTYIQPLDRVAEEREGRRARDEVHRFHATPMSTVKLNGQWRSFEQRVVCGRGVTAVYSGI